MNQGPPPPFDPRAAVKKFAAVLKEYGLARVTGDAYAGETFRRDFEAEGISYTVATGTTSDHFEALEVKLNAGEVELLDMPTLIEQVSGLVMRGGKVTHASGEHDDWSAVTSGVVAVLDDGRRQLARMFHALTGQPIPQDDDPLGLFTWR